MNKIALKGGGILARVVEGMRSYNTRREMAHKVHKKQEL